MEKLAIMSEQEVKDECPYTPTTCYKKLRGVVSEVDDLVTFKKFEEMSNFEGEYKSLQLSIKDANVASLQEEIVQLKAQLKQCTESSDLDKKDANIKLFRLQQELEQKNIEILLLKKEKSEFDLQINLLKSRCARKEKDLQEALNLSQPAGSTQPIDSELEISKLQTQMDGLKASQVSLHEELQKSKFEIENLEQVLKIKTDHAHLLSLAFDDLLSDFKQISSEASELIDSVQVNDQFTFDSLEPIDLSALNTITDFINIRVSPFNWERFVAESDTIEVNTILKEAVSNLTLWFKSVLNDWQSDIDNWHIPDSHDIEELTSIYQSLKNHQLNSTSQVQSDAATGTITVDTIEFGIQTSFIENPNDSEKGGNLIVEIDELKMRLVESQAELENLTNNFETTINALKVENEELLRKYNNTKDILTEAEKHQSLVEETTAEVVKELKEELGDRTVKLLLSGAPENLNEMFVDAVIKDEPEWNLASGMSTFLSAKDEAEPSSSICEDRDVTSTVGTAFALPREHSDNLASFAQEFAEFLLTNQVFLPQDSLPTDPSVFYFLLDKYLMLVETYHQTRSAFEENLNALEEQDKVARVKAEALLSQLSQLEVTDSTLCDSSLTASSVDFDTDVRSSTMYENNEQLNDTSLHIIHHSFVENNDFTHDPLQITINNVPRTPVPTPAKRPTSINSSKIPVCRATPSAHMQTLQEGSLRHSILLNGSVNDSKLPPSTPIMRIIRREPCSTAKKSVTFQSPLLARNATELENSKLKAVLDEKLGQIDKLEQSIVKHVSNIAQIEERTVTLEKLSSEAYYTLERAETEFSEKRDKLEAELNHVKSQLADVTNKLIVEAINLNPDLQNRLTAITPPQVLKILLDTIIARCEKEQEEAKKSFEHDREEWSNEIVQITTTNQCLQQKLDDLTSQNKQMGFECEELGVIEEDLLRLTAENIQLEKTNVELVKESMQVKEKVEGLEHEIVTLKDHLFMTEGEKECLISDKCQLEQDKEKLGKEYDSQLKMLQNVVDSLNSEIAELRNNIISGLRQEITTLTSRNAETSQQLEILKLELDEKYQMLSTSQRDVDVLKAQIITQESEISQLKLSETNAANNRIEEIEHLKKEMENLKKEQMNNLKILEEKNGTLQEELDAVNQLVATFETEIANLHLSNLSKANTDNNMVEEIKSLKLQLENSTREKVNDLKIAEEKEDFLSTLQSELQSSKIKMVQLENDISEMLLAKTNSDNCRLEELESLKIELENTKKENESHLKVWDDKNRSWQDEVDSLKKQVETQQQEIAELEAKADKLMLDKECELKILTEKNLALQEEVDTIENKLSLLNHHHQVCSNQDPNKIEELESLKLSLDNCTKEKEGYQSTLNDAENTLKLAESAIEAIAHKFMCESNLPSDLPTKINYLCNLVTKKLIHLEEDNKRISLLEKEIAEVKIEKEQIDILMKQVEMTSEVLEGDKCLVESELSELKQRMAVMEQSIKEKDELLLTHTVELESLRRKLAEKTKELQTSEASQLEVQKQLLEAKEDEMRALKSENQSTVAELNNLKCEKEQVLSRISTCTLQFESEIEKHKLATIKADNLQTEIDNLKQELECMRVYEENHKADMNLIILEKSKLEECLSAVEQNLRLAEERLLAAEARNNEFEEELLLLKDELIKNKVTTEELSKKLSELENSYKDAKREKTDLIEKLEQFTTLNNNLSKEKNEIKEKLDSLIEEKEHILVKLTDISESKELIEEKDGLVVRLEEFHSKYNQLTKTLEELTTAKTSLTQELDSLKKSNESLSNDKDQMRGHLADLTDKHNCQTNGLIKQLNELEEIKNSLTSEKETLLKDLADVNSVLKAFQEEKMQLQLINKNEKDLLNVKLSEFSHARESLQVEKDMLTAKINELNQTINGFTTEKDVLFKELQAVVEDRSVLANENRALQAKMTENEHSVKTLTEEKSILISKLDEITQSRDILETENNTFVYKVEELTEKVEQLSKELEEKCHNISELVTKLEYFDSDNEKLRQNLEEYKKTESSMLKKLLEKNWSDEMVHRLQSQLSNAESIISGLNVQIESMRQELNNKTDSLLTAQREMTDLTSEVKQLKAIINNLTKDNDVLSNNFKEQGKELRFKSKSLDDVTAIVENLKSQVTKKEKESEEANSLLSERAEKINNLNNQMEKLCNSNAELKQLLSHVQVTLGLPEEAIQHLSADQNTRSRLRLFKDNVDGIQSKNQAISNENQKLTIELEKLTTEKVQFKIKEAEFHTFGREMDDKIQELTNKLAKLESAPSRRSKRQDPIGPRRLEKLEELNTTLHELLMRMLSMLEMPNVDKLRLISQREVDSATKQILDHVATLANARDSLDALKEQIKSLDQENQELSDNFEALLKDNNKLELRIVELEKSNQSSACCACAKLRKSLKEKDTEVDELSTKVKELDEENESLSNDVEALLKDNNKLEMKLIQLEKGAGSFKSCSACDSLKNNLKIKEEEMSELKLTISRNTELLHAAEEDLVKMKEKCEQLESSLSNKEQYLLRAINERVRGDEVRMSGITGGMVRDIDLNEKVRRLTKDNDALRVLLRERARTIKKYEAEQKSTDPNTAMNTNCMDSPIRERGYNLRTRADLPIGNKRSLRPHSEGIENIRI